MVTGDTGLRFGTATFPENGTSVDELLDAARTAMVRGSHVAPPPASGPRPVVVGERMRAVWEMVDRVAAANLPVLVLGETGSGKEVVARALHGRSARREGPLKSVNCAAIPQNLLESALFVSENPPLRVAFDDLVTRMHLIQNPALMLQALANLYLHSLRYLDEPDQAFLMARLRRLQKVLDESHYQDLYEEHIEKRYSWAIENRLAEFLEAEESLLEEEEPEKG